MSLATPSTFRTTGEAIAASIAETKASPYAKCPRCHRPLKREFDLSAGVGSNPRDVPCQYCEAKMRKVIVTEDCIVAVDGVKQVHYVPSAEPYKVTDHAFNVITANEWGHEPKEEAAKREKALAGVLEANADKPDGPLSDVSAARTVTRTEPLAAPEPTAQPPVVEAAVPPSPTARPKKK